MNLLHTIVIILTLLAAILLIGIVLIQKSKGGGLSSSFAGSNQIMGVRRTNDIVEKTTWYLAAAVAVLAILSVFTAPSMTHSIRTQMETSMPADLNFSAPAASQEAPAVEAAASETPAPAAE